MKGCYLLVVYNSTNIKLKIGALGEILFEEGYYFYVGSAMGNSGSSTLINRVKRHVSPSKNKKTHWHIDYLLDNKKIFIHHLFLIPSSQNMECTIANELFNVSDGYINKFGSSDCKCKSHLLYFKNLPSLDNLF